MTDKVLQGWHKDPFGLHESRYFSAGSPTKLVRDGLAEGYDEPPSGDYEWADAAAGQDTGARSGAPVATAGPGFTDDPPKRSRVGLLSAGVIAAAAAAVAGVLIASGTTSRSPALSPAAFVTQSAQRTMAERTVEIAVTGAVSAGISRVTVHGTGQEDFTRDAFELSVGFSAGGQSFTLDEIAVNGNMYLAVSAGGHGPGRQWVRVPGQVSKSDLIGGNPSALLSALEKVTTVRVLGTQTVGGMSCTGYSAADEGQQVTVWFNGQGLLCRIGVHLRAAGPAKGRTATGGAYSVSLAISGDLVLDFSHYGGPVHIAAPAPSDTTSYSSFVRELFNVSLRD